MKGKGEKTEEDDLILKLRSIKYIIIIITIHNHIQILRTALNFDK